MSYIDPDLLHGVMDNVITAVNDNATTLSGKGVTAATVATRLTAIRDDLQDKKDDRDKKRTALGVSQRAYDGSAAGNYAEFSGIIDTVAGALGKTTPAGKQVLGYRQHVTGSDQRSSPQPAPAPAAAARGSA